jgi:hypothetical protein
MSRPGRRTRATPRHADVDGAWKQALQVLLPDFLALAHRDLHAALDWSQPITFLDKELQAITRRGRKGRRAVDLLASVHRLGGGEQWLLVHVEVQGRIQETFPWRMFTYHARLVDRYEHPVVSLAVLTDGQVSWRPEAYEHDYWGCAVTFRYPVVKVLDWQGREEELARMANPFAQVLLAQLAVLTSRGQVAASASTWLAIMRRLARAGYTYEQISAVLTFLDQVVVLPEEIEMRVEAELAELEGATMPQLMSRWEAEALQIREQRGRQALVLEQLADQCGPLPEEAAAQVRELSPDQLYDLGRALLRFGSLADLVTWLAAHPDPSR